MTRLRTPDNVTNKRFDIGAVINGRYRIDAVLGRGGMGVIVAVTHLRLQTSFAIKLLLGEDAADPDTRARFEREAMAAARLRSRYVVRVYDVDATPQGELFIVMELLRGRDLSTFVRTEGATVDVRRAVDWMIQVCSAMHEAHGAGIIHRDLKPSNLFLDEQAGIVRVVDFGISKVLDSGDLTGAGGSMIGTPRYMAPEQLLCRTVDSRTDLFAVALILYELIAGRIPWPHSHDAAAVFSSAMARLTTPPISIDELVVGLPSGFAPMLMKGLARDPDNRYGSARELALALTPFGSGAERFEPAPSPLRDLPDTLKEVSPSGIQRSLREVPAGAPVSAVGNEKIDPLGPTFESARPTRTLRRMLVLGGLAILALLTTIVTVTRLSGRAAPSATAAPPASVVDGGSSTGEAAPVALSAKASSVPDEPSSVTSRPSPPTHESARPPNVRRPRPGTRTLPASSAVPGGPRRDESGNPVLL